MTTAPAPGSPDWGRLVTASKIPVILGVSPYNSPYRLWLEMKGRIEREPAGDAALRGHCLEEGVLEFFEAKHPDWVRVGTQVPVWDELEPRFLATLDAVFTTPEGETVIVEVKTVGRTWEHWRTPEGDRPPAYYEAQVRFQLALYHDADYALVVALGPFLDISEYRIDRDDELDGDVYQAAVEWLTVLDSDTPPALDDTVATYEAVRALAPGQPAGTVEVPANIAIPAVNAHVSLKDMDRVARGAKTRLTAVMGDAETATCNGEVIAKRVKRGDRPAFTQITATKNTLAILTEGRPQ